MRRSTAIVCLLFTSACARARVPVLPEPLPPLPPPDPPVVGEPVVVQPWPSTAPLLRELRRRGDPVALDECDPAMSEGKITLRLTFDSAGGVEEVAAEPDELEADALVCVKRSFATLRAPSFAGREVRVGRAHRP